MLIFRSIPPSQQCTQCTRHVLESVFLFTTNTPRLSTSRTRHQPWTKRQFSSIGSRQGAMRPESFRPTRPAQPSLMVAMERARQKQMREMRENPELRPDGFAVLPQTFILSTKPGTWKNWPLLKVWIKSKSRDFITYLYLRYWSYRKLKIDYDVPKISKIAEELHEKMFKAFAAGSLDSVRSSLCSGMYDSLQKRVVSRPYREYLDWQIVKRPSSSKLVSYRSTPIPVSEDGKGGDDNCIIQAVVRLHTVQRLEKKRHANPNKPAKPQNEPTAPDNSTEKVSLEYLVLNKMVKEGEQGPWKVWGFTTETTLKSIAEEQVKLAELERANDAINTQKRQKA